MQNHITSEELYGTAGENIYSTGKTIPHPKIYAPVTNVVGQDIYGTSVTATMQDIYSTAPPGMDIYGTAQQIINGNALQSGDINGIRKSNTILPIIPRPSVLPPVVPLEATLSSVFIRLSSTRLNDPDFNLYPKSRSNTTQNLSSIASNATSSPIPHMGTGIQSTRSANSTAVIPQPSKFTPIMSTLAPVIKVDTASSRVSTQPSINSNPISNLHKPNGIESFGTPSTRHHSTMQRNFIDLTSSHNPQETRHIAASSKLIPEISHQPSIPIPSISKKRKSIVPTVDS